MDLLLPLLLFLALVIVRIPVAFAMLAVAMVYLLVQGTPLSLLTQKVAGGVDSFSLLAVPLFLATGFLMNTMGITDRIFAFASALVRQLPGGLAHVNVVASLVFAGMSGSSVADAGGLGVVEIRAMKEAGYRTRFSAAVTAASALIGPIIPPSIVMVIYAFVTEVSLGRMFLAGLLPGLLMAGSMMLLIYGMAKTGVEPCPQMERASAAEVWDSFKKAILPILAPVILVGGILSGAFTPTEAGVAAVLYVLVIGSILLNFSPRHILMALMEAARSTTATLFVVAAAVIFTWIVSTAGVPARAGELINSWTSSPEGVLLIIVAMILVLGMVMEGIPILMVFGPIFMTVAQGAGVDLIHLGIVFIVTMMIGGITPPVGITLYVVMSIANVSLTSFMRGIWPFYFAILAVILLLVFVPGFSLWLPDLVYGK